METTKGSERSSHLSLVRDFGRDFGYLPHEIAVFEAMTPPTLVEIATMIVSEPDLTRYGRWRGQPAPRRWVPPIGWRPRVRLP